MALTSRFGTSSPDGKTTPGPKKVDRLAAQAAQLAAKKPTQASVESMEQSAPVPARTRAGTDASTEPAPHSVAPPPPGAGARADGRVTDPSRPTLEHRSIDAIRPSPFQPKGRPSVAAVDGVRLAITEAGSLEALVSREGAPIFARLSPEAARLAELAYSIAEHGVKDPIELRTAEDGAEECLSGHRRLAAARLAGHTEVPIFSRGRLSSAQAAAMVLNGNLHRENFTAWQEAVLVTQVQERRKADGLPSDVRTLSSVMGWSTGKVHHLLKARQLFGPSALARLGDGDSARLEEGLARLQRAELKRLVEIADEATRAAATRRAIGWPTAAANPEPAAARAVCTQRPKRGGGFVLEVNAPVEDLAAGDAALVHEVLSAQLARVRTRLEQLGHPVRG